MEKDSQSPEALLEFWRMQRREAMHMLREADIRISQLIQAYPEHFEHLGQTVNEQVMNVLGRLGVNETTSDKLTESNDGEAVI